MIATQIIEKHKNNIKQFLCGICRASLWSAIARGTKEYTWPTNRWIIFMYFLEYWLKYILSRYLVNSVQNQMRPTKWHSAIDRLMRSTCWPPVAVDCIALSYCGKHMRKMLIWGIKLTGKQPAAIELHRRVHSTDTELHCHYTWTSEVR